MSTVTPIPDQGEPGREHPRRLPIRWGLIATWTVAAAGAAFVVGGGPLAAIPMACAVAVAAHRLLD